jgi:tRNA threonylcarbamoyladenosine biosynthesis protein TsaB
MSNILCIDTSTTNCSVGLSIAGSCVSLKEVNVGYTHAENITVFIEEVLAASKITMDQLDAIAVSKGPGSYTGLRIGVSAAKGLAYALSKPLISIDTLSAMALSVSQNFSENDLLCPMIDARRMEVYCAVFDRSLNILMPTKALIIDNTSFSEFLQQGRVIFFGDGASKCKAIIDHPNAEFISDMFPSAASMGPLAEQLFAEKRFEDVAAFEPFYLKDFIAGKGSVYPPQR